jgi:metal-responsive CopG/Arc/MetJ family transcriptional regulator
MRAIIDLPDQQAEQLQLSCEREGISRAEAVRRAISLYIEQQTAHQHMQGITHAFGLWKKRGKRSLDGVAYQRRIRSEWD